MDFKLSEEQRLLQESVGRFIAAEYPLEKRRDYIKQPDGFSRDNWRKLAELGLLGLPLPEEVGGSGGSSIDVMVVMEQFGRGLVVEPYLASVVLCGGLLKRLAGNDRQRGLLARLGTGDALMAFAQGERQARYTLHDIEATARRDGDSFVLNGHKSVVLHGDSADTLIISARSAGAARDTHGISLFLVDRGADGLKVRGSPTIDGLRSAEITLADVRVGADALLGPLDRGYPAIERAVDAATAAVCAEAVGAMAVLIEATLDYLKTRQQFGAPIGRNQALQHRMVDVQIAYEQARSMACLAAMMADSDDDDARRRAISAAKVQIGRAGKFVGQQAVQLHGGIAMTDEYKVGHYFKRLTMIGAQFGDVDYHLGRFAGLSEPNAEAA
ncbi:MAG TPA: acyl-CoA dehydrogenase family protein [Alphaproteobacteria bacterium]|nr:acyl-CoA dehydrogenase family protein [Alphaproteobacteria bacterium]